MNVFFLCDQLKKTPQEIRDMSIEDYILIIEYYRLKFKREEEDLKKIKSK